MSPLKATEVFTPGDYPNHTYVQRNSAAMEERLRNALDTPGEVVSVSGPSKSGKTVLVQRVVGSDNLIAISGAGIRTPDELWERILDWMDVPTGQSTTRAVQAGGTVGASGTLSGGLPILKAGGTTSAEFRVEGTASSTSERGRRGLPDVVKEIGGSEFIVFIDDFHYMHRDVQVEVALAIKDAAAQKVKVIVASVPHRADDVVRSNPELRGRVRNVDVGYWNIAELREIGTKGFPLLNMTVPAASVDRLASEASGSPQLMQAMCLDVCFAHGVRTKAGELVEAALSDAALSRILGDTTTRTDHRRLVKHLHGGPPLRGKKRTGYKLRNGGTGDVYRCILLTLASDPPTLSWTYAAIAARMSALVVGDRPTAQSVYESCAQMAKMAQAISPSERLIEWDEQQRLLEIVDPYFLFYLRWSGALDDLQGTGEESR